MLSDKKRKRRSNIQENLLLLYLRLSGYFVSGFIVHSPEHGKSKTQIDALAVRHAFNREPRREVQPSPFLSPTGTDLLICEVKSRGQSLQFNKSFRESDAAIEEVLGWAGLFDTEKTARIARELKPLLQPKTPAGGAKAGVVEPEDIRVRPLLCSPEILSCRDNQPWFLCGSELFSYISKCLNPTTVRNACSIRYDFDVWGTSLAPLVRYFKERPAGDPGKIENLYQFLGNGTRLGQ